MNKTFEAILATSLFVVMLAFLTSSARDTIMSNTEQAAFISLKKRAYTIASNLKLWIESGRLQEIREMDDQSFRKNFVNNVSLTSDGKNIEDKVSYYVVVRPTVNVSVISENILVSTLPNAHVFVIKFIMKNGKWDKEISLVQTPFSPISANTIVFFYGSQMVHGSIFEHKSLEEMLNLEPFEIFLLQGDSLRQVSIKSGAELKEWLDYSCVCVIVTCQDNKIYYTFLPDLFPHIRKGEEKIPSYAVSVIDVTEAGGTLCSIEAYLWR